MNRLDEIVFYKPLRKEDIVQIIDILISGLKARLAEKTLRLVITEAAKNIIIEHGFDPVYGARPLKRYLQSKVETLIAKTIISRDLPVNAELTVDADAQGVLYVKA